MALEMTWDEQRIKRICEAAIERLGLNLAGLKIVTEAASGLYVVTPLLALQAGAAEVICLGKDTGYGTFASVRQNLSSMATRWRLPVPVFTDDRKDSRLEGADIVTNLGMVRPLDRDLLTHIGPQTVIPYMCEAWEFREGDVDLETCNRMGIPVMGTDENHPSVGVFQYCGILAIKMILEAGFEVINNRIAILGSEQFGPVIKAAIAGSGAQVTLFTGADGYRGVEEQTWDIILVAEYCKEVVLGRQGRISGERLEKLTRRASAVIQFIGSNEIGDLPQDIHIYPHSKMPPQRMAKTLADVGPWPVILLHAAGLLVGEKMARAKRQNLSKADFIRLVCQNAPAQPI